jgi:poly(A) polymerase
MSDRERLVAAFRAAGHQLWTVGGALRDRELGRPVADEDFATDALPDAVEAIAVSLGRPVTAVGKKFGTIGAQLDGRWSEITTFRGDSYEAGTRWPDVTFGTSIEEDLARRDFTMNALAEDTATGAVLDLFGGRADIEGRVIRAVGEPEQRFREDPLRILRGIRFASQLDFAVDAATEAAMASTAALIATLSQERITAELDRLLGGAQPERGLELLRTTGALAVALPELAPMVGCDQNSYHRFDVWGHTVATVTAIEGDTATLRMRRWAALLHDIAKPYVRHTKQNGEWGFYGHEVEGEKRAAALAERLRIGRREERVLALLVRRHMDRPNVEERRSVRRFLSRSQGHWADLVALKRADNASHTYDDRTYIDALAAMCERIAAEDAEALLAESPLTGTELAQLAERDPGPWIRPIKEALSAMVLDGDLRPGDRDGAERAARVMLGMEQAQQ